LVRRAKTNVVLLPERSQINPLADEVVKLECPISGPGNPAVDGVARLMG